MESFGLDDNFMDLHKKKRSPTEIGLSDMERESDLHVFIDEFKI